MKIGYMAGAALLLFSALATGAQAGVYTADDLLGADGSVTGTITTDGTLGALDPGDIVGWNLLLNDGTTTATLTNLNSGVFFSGNASATASVLQFDFNGDTNYLNFFGGICGGPEWSFENTGSGGSCNGTTGNAEGVLVSRSGSLQVSPEQGEVTFASTAVPEPVTLSLFGAGLAGAAAMRRRKKKTA